MTSTEVDLLTEPEALRRPLTAYAYRMLVASAESDDAAREAIVRAPEPLRSLPLGIRRRSG